MAEGGPLAVQGLPGEILVGGGVGHIAAIRGDLTQVQDHVRRHDLIAVHAGLGDQDPPLALHRHPIGVGRQRDTGPRAPRVLTRGPTKVEEVGVAASQGVLGGVVHEHRVVVGARPLGRVRRVHVLARRHLCGEPDIGAVPEMVTPYTPFCDMPWGPTDTIRVSPVCRSCQKACDLPFVTPSSVLIESNATYRPSSDTDTSPDG